MINAQKGVDFTLRKNSMLLRNTKRKKIPSERTRTLKLKFETFKLKIDNRKNDNMSIDSSRSELTRERSSQNTQIT